MTYKEEYFFFKKAYHEIKKYGKFIGVDGEVWDEKSLKEIQKKMNYLVGCIKIVNKECLENGWSNCLIDLENE